MEKRLGIGDKNIPVGEGRVRNPMSFKMAGCEVKGNCVNLVVEILVRLVLFIIFL
jgi:hypothetical protein